ncbi:hypothetical protein GCM10007275_14790 [Jeotgalicoccus coquinae]|nr:hypothetical protein GCM10007275_14790 [Jeotgalicoccus coquinae]
MVVRFFLVYINILPKKPEIRNPAINPSRNITIHPTRFTDVSSVRYRYCLYTLSGAHMNQYLAFCAASSYNIKIVFYSNYISAGEKNEKYEK